MKFWSRKDEWFKYAACFGSADHTLPPSRDDDGPTADPLHVWFVCLFCRVRPECAQWVVDGSENGVWSCGRWVPGHDEDKRGAKDMRHRLFESIDQERRERGEDV